MFIKISRVFLQTKVFQEITRIQVLIIILKRLFLITITSINCVNILEVIIDRYVQEWLFYNLKGIFNSIFALNWDFHRIGLEELIIESHHKIKNITRKWVSRDRFLNWLWFIAMWWYTQLFIDKMMFLQKT